MAEPLTLKLGEAAPDFFARTTEGCGVWLQSFRGRMVVLSFLPKASTSGADQEALRFRARAAAFQRLGAELIGVSMDDLETQCRFVAMNELPFALMPDPAGAIARKYGVLQRAIGGARSTTFLIDEAGLIQAIFDHELHAADDVGDVLAFVEARQKKIMVESPRSSLRSIHSGEGVVVQGRYRLKQLVGRGGLGEVWRAEHLHLKRDVAVKILTDPPEDAGEDWIEPCVQRFRFEAQVSALLGARTRHVVSVFDAGYDPIGPYLAMEFVEGRALDQEVAVRGALPPGELSPLLDQLGEALEAAHQAGIIHRDLKPANVMLMRDERGAISVKLTDFGIAKALPGAPGFDRPKDTAVTQLVGTPEYMAPEQLRGSPPAVAMDVWALGVLVYEALTGEVPFDAPSMPELILKVMRESPAKVSASNPRLAPLDAWMDRALAKEPADRFPTIAGAVSAYHLAVVREPSSPALLAVRETRSAAPVETPARMSITNPRGRSGLALIGMLAGGVAMTALLWVARTHESPTVTTAAQPPVEAPKVAAPTDAAAPPTAPSPASTQEASARPPAEPKSVGPKPPRAPVVPAPPARETPPARQAAPARETPPVRETAEPVPPPRPRPSTAPRRGVDPSSTF